MGIESVVNTYRQQLLRLPNVTGVGIGERNRKEVIVVFVTHRVVEAALEPDEIVPKELDGFEVDVRIQIRIGQS